MVAERINGEADLDPNFVEVTIKRLADNMKMNNKERTKMDPIRGKCAEFGSLFRSHRMNASGHRVIYLEDAELKVVQWGRFEVD